MHKHRNDRNMAAVKSLCCKSTAFDSVTCYCLILTLIGHFGAEKYMVEGDSGLPTPVSQADAPQITTEVRTCPGQYVPPEITGEMWLYKNNISCATKSCKLEFYKNIMLWSFCANFQ